MITIPAIQTETPNGPLLSPETPIPADALEVQCDGINYTVYQLEDTIPAS
jgi:hypothetical protein